MQFKDMEFPKFQIGFINQSRKSKKIYHILPKEWLINGQFLILKNMDETIYENITMNNKTWVLCQDEQCRDRFKSVLNITFQKQKIRQEQSSINFSSERKEYLLKKYNINQESFNIYDYVEVIATDNIKLNSIQFRISYHNNNNFVHIIYNTNKQDKTLKLSMHNQNFDRIAFKHSPKEFQIIKLNQKNSWSVKINQNVYVINPVIVESPHISQITKLIITNSNSQYITGLLYLYCYRRISIPIITSYPIYYEIIRKISIILNLKQIYIQKMFPCNLVTPNQILNESKMLLKFTYCFYKVPSLSISIYYKNRGIKIYCDWLFNNKLFYLQYKKEKITEERYLELINLNFKQNLCLIQNCFISQDEYMQFKQFYKINSNCLFFGGQENQIKILQPYVVLDTLEHYDANQKQKIQKLYKIYFLQEYLHLEKILNVLEMTQEERFTPGQTIIKKNMKSTKIYFILKGKIQIDYQNSQEKQELSQNNIIAQYLLFQDCKNKYTAKCLTEVILLSIRKQCFLFHFDFQILENLKLIYNFNLPPQLFQIRIFDNINIETLKQILFNSPVITIAKNQLITQDEFDIWIILKGEIKINIQKYQTTKKQGQIIMNSKLKLILPKKNNIIMVATTEIKLLKIEIAKFQKLLTLDFKLNKLLY